jgi:hypothetical protein
MAGDNIDPGDVGPGVVVHFSAAFPVKRTACGVPGPSLWRYVSCPRCLDVAPRDPRIEQRRRALGLPARGLDRGR